MAAKSRKGFVVSLPFEQFMPAMEQAVLKVGMEVLSVDRTKGNIKAKKGVVDPKNWTLPLGVEFTRKEVYDGQEAQKF